jgi:hypothetical protein
MGQIIFIEEPAVYSHLWGGGGAFSRVIEDRDNNADRETVRA